MKRSATAKWQGDGASGSGVLTTQSGVLKEQPYSFHLRFKDEEGKSGTNPEELIAAAHAGCFTMALSFGLAKAGFVAEELQTQAHVDLQMQEGGFSITGIELVLNAKVPGIDDAKFQELAATAKANCPVSRALASTPMTLKAALV